ncbi:MAG: cytochrome P450, partial [Acidimicrobiales bacterium]
MTAQTYVDDYLDDHGPDDADITSHDTYVNGVPHATFTRLRTEDPIHWTDEADGSGFWSILRHDDVMAVSRDVQTFTSSKGIRLEEMDPEQLEARRTMMELDPPDHTRYRRLVSKGFTP